MVPESPLSPEALGRLPTPPKVKAGFESYYSRMI